MSLAPPQINRDPPLAQFIYRISASDTLTFVSDAWLDFARENEAAQLSKEAILSRSLWDFIADPETRHLYEILFKRVRTARSEIVLGFRCDSPELRRFMELQIRPLPEGELEIASHLIREESRPAVALLDSAREDRAGQVLSLCSWCKRIRVDASSWLEVEDAVEALRLFDKPELPPISHVTCPDCYETAIETLRRGPSPESDS